MLNEFDHRMILPTLILLLIGFCIGYFTCYVHLHLKLDKYCGWCRLKNIEKGIE